MPKEKERKTVEIGPLDSVLDWMRKNRMPPFDKDIKIIHHNERDRKEEVFIGP